MPQHYPLTLEAMLRRMRDECYKGDIAWLLQDAHYADLQAAYQQVTRYRKPALESHSFFLLSNMQGGQKQYSRSQKNIFVVFGVRHRAVWLGFACLTVVDISVWHHSFGIR
jgi:hypothetical protein